MKFTEISQTQPGQAYTASDLIRRSLNGTMPAIYKEGTYEAEEGKSYEEQEKDDFFLDSEPQLEDLSELKDYVNSTKESVANAVAEARKKFREKKSADKTASTERQHDLVDELAKKRKSSSPVEAAD